MNQQRIIEYRIVSSNEHWDFTEIVNRMIKRGYQPYGNTFMANDTINNEPYYYQPMVKYESKIKKEPRWKTWKREKELEKRGLNEIENNEIIVLDDIILKKTKSI